jgi:uncharacterized protein DUF4386
MDKARIAGVFYLLVFVTGGAALLGGRIGPAAGLVAGLLYVVVTLLFYDLFKPVNGRLSLLAAAVSLAGVAAGPALRVNPLPLFGIYCLLIGYLVFRSGFLPRTLGVLLAFAGVGWLTFLSAPLARALAPFNFVPGIVGEGALTVWLLLFGIQSRRARLAPPAAHSAKWA